MKWTNIHKISVFYFAFLIQTITPVPCQTPLGLSFKIRESDLTFQVLVSSGNRAGLQLNGKEAWTPTGKLDQSSIQITASEAVLLTGLLLQGGLEGQGRITSWSLAVSEDCHDYLAVQNYSLPEDVSKPNQNAIVVNVSLHSLVFAKCIRLVPLRYVGTTASLRLELLGCEIGTNQESCKKDLLLTPTFHVSRNADNNDVDSNYLHNENVAVDMSNSTGISTEEKLFEEHEQAANYSSDIENIALEIIDNRTNDKISNDNSLLVDEGLQGNDSDEDQLRSEIIISENFAFLFQNSPLPDLNVSREDDIGMGTVSKEKEDCGTTPYPKKHIRRKRVVLGHKNSPGEWPWLVSLHFLPETDFTRQSGFGHMCGANLISPQWLIGAAHCFADTVMPGLENLTEWRVYLGLHDQASNGESESVQVRNISFVIRHTDFGQGFLGDILLIKMDRPVEYTDTIKPICMDDTDHFYNSAVCYVTGWGQQSLDSPGTRFPYTTALTVMTSQECADNYALLPEDHEFKGHVRTEPDMLCAYGPGGEDACRGDSGSGLYCTIDDKWYLVAITVGGYKCGEKDFPGFYSRISHYQKWIQMNIQAYDKY